MLLDKPKGLLCTQVLNQLKKVTGREKIGHAGTLDPIADGLLIVGIGKATRILSYIGELEKEYMCGAEMGKNTDSYDITGNITYIHKGEFPEAEDIKITMNAFIGEINQVPPSYSAVKVKGVRSYKMARKGCLLELPARKIRIKSIEFVKWDKNERHFICKVTCSKGTYIRSLIMDIGARLKCGASVSSLRRLRIGEFHVGNGCRLESLDNLEFLKTNMLTVNDALYFLKPLFLNQRNLESLQKSGCFEIEFHDGRENDPNRIVKGITNNGKVYALLEQFQKHNRLYYRTLCMLES
ncbi:MAG: tRNA pseudouridine(55) synthase TruB [bacterium]